MVYRILKVTALTSILAVSSGSQLAADQERMHQQTQTQMQEWEQIYGSQLNDAERHSEKSDSDTSITNSTSIGSNLSPREVRQLIDLHTMVRADVGVDSLSWSKKLAIYAQEWADHLASMGCKMEHRPKAGRWKREHGENLFMGTSGYHGVADAVNSWAGEKKYYKGKALNSSNWYNSGHYTQVIWKNTKQVGCARSECNNGRIVIVCNYDPPGNVMGQTPY